MRLLAVLRSHRRALLVAFALAGLGALASVFLWQGLRGYERDRISNTAEAVADGLAHELEARLESRLAAGRGLAGFLAEHRFRSREAWLHAATLYARHNDFASLARVDPVRGETWVATVSGNSPPAVRSLENAQAIDGAQERAAREGVETVAGPFRTARGGYALWLVFPIGDRSRTSGLLIASLDIDSFLDRFLAARARDYAVSLRHLDREVYRRGQGTPDAAAARFSVELSNGLLWSGAVQPTPPLVARSTTPLPAITLAAGLLISVLLALAAWLTHLARVRARALSDANRSVQREFAMTRTAESALRKLNSELEERVEVRTAELRELVAELEAFNYSVSHDLRSPLGAVVNFAAILEQEYEAELDREGRGYLDRITSSAESALSLMDGLLSFSRLGRKELKLHRVDVEGLVEEVVAELKAMGPASGARIEIGSLPPADADPEMLRVVFTNLVSNALKFSRDREQPRVEIGASRPGEEVVYRVQDNGVGFDPALADKLFSVFERLHSKDHFEGSGVGLATAARIIRRHGGRIWAKGAPDEGAAFSFTLTRGKGSHGEASAR